MQGCTKVLSWRWWKLLPLSGSLQRILNCLPSKQWCFRRVWPTSRRKVFLSLKESIVKWASHSHHSHHSHQTRPPQLVSGLGGSAQQPKQTKERWLKGMLQDKYNHAQINTFINFWWNLKAALQLTWSNVNGNGVHINLLSRRRYNSWTCCKGPSISENNFSTCQSGTFTNENNL